VVFFEKKGKKMNLNDKVESICHIHGSYMACIVSLGGRELPTKCPKCIDEWQAEYEALRNPEKKDGKINYLEEYAYMAIPSRYCGVKLPTINPTNEAQKVAIKKIIRATNGGIKSFVLFGETGTGKTHLLTAALAGLSGVSCGYTTLYGMVSRILDSIRERRGAVASQRLAYTLPDVLVIDDVSGMRNQYREVLDDIITARHAENRPIMIGTDLPLDSFRAVIGERSGRRLKEMGAECIFTS
jgi:DNA replication protein DnaC